MHAHQKMSVGARAMPSLLKRWHARRKFFELHATNKSMLAEQTLRYIQLLYEIESEVRDL